MPAEQEPLPRSRTGALAPQQNRSPCPAAEQEPLPRSRASNRPGSNQRKTAGHYKDPVNHLQDAPLPPSLQVEAEEKAKEEVESKKEEAQKAAAECEHFNLTLSPTNALALIPP